MNIVLILMYFIFFKGVYLNIRLCNRNNEYLTIRIFYNLYRYAMKVMTHTYIYVYECLFINHYCKVFHRMAMALHGPAR